MKTKKCWNCPKDVPVDAKSCPYCEVYGSSTPLMIGPYEPVQALGHGQFGRVFRAQNRLFKENTPEVAIKLLSSPLASGEIEQELHLLSLLPKENPNLVHVHQDSCAKYIVMDFVKGKNLYKRVREHPEETKKNFGRIFEGICNGLYGLHNLDGARILIHRDLKPGNILITDEWQAKIVDMGLAKIASATSPARSKAGSREVAAPEVFALKAGEDYDNRVDLWALGVIVYFIWTGKFPFGTDIQDDPDYKEPGQIERAVVAMQFPRPESLNPAIPAEVIDLIDHLLCLREDRIGAANTARAWVSGAAFDSAKKPQDYLLSDYQRQLVALYGGSNAGRHPAILVCHCLSHVEFLCNAILKSKSEADINRVFSQHLPKLFAWMCALADGAGWKLGDIIFFKYPDRCPYCDAKPCTGTHKLSNATINESLLKKVLSRANEEAKSDWKFKDFSKMFSEIYKKPNQKRSQSDIILRLYGEFSEFAGALDYATRSRTRTGTAILYLELADLFAWFFALCNAMPSNFSFEKEFWKLFAKCPWCQESPPCKCSHVPEELQLTNWRLSRATLAALDIAGND